MAPYIFLAGIVFAFYSLLRRVNGLAGKKAMVYSWTAAMLLTLLLGLRHPSMGVDVGGYLQSFRQLSSMTWTEILRLKSFLNYEKGYILFNKLVGSIRDSEQFFLLCCAAASFLPIGTVIGRYSYNCRTSFLIYLGLTAFVITFSGLRQAIAIAIAFSGFPLVVERKLFRYGIVVAAACSFHSSAAVAILIYPMYWLRLDRAARFATIGMLPILFLLRSHIWNWIVRLTGRGTLAEHSGSVNLMLLFFGIYVYMAVFSPEKSRFDGLANIHFLCCCVLIFSEVSTVVQRVSYYFMLYLTLSLPQLLQGIRVRQGEREYTLHLMAVTGGFLLLGLYNLRTITWAGAYPYRFFWEL